jgi:hypothetical protein
MIFESSAIWFATSVTNLLRFSGNDWFHSRSFLVFRLLLDPELQCNTAQYTHHVNTYTSLYQYMNICIYIYEYIYMHKYFFSLPKANTRTQILSGTKSSVKPSLTWTTGPLVQITLRSLALFARNRTGSKFLRDATDPGDLVGDQSRDTLWSHAALHGRSHPNRALLVMSCYYIWLLFLESKPYCWG